MCMWGFLHEVWFAQIIPIYGLIFEKSNRLLQNHKITKQNRYKIMYCLCFNRWQVKNVFGYFWFWPPSGHAGKIQPRPPWHSSLILNGLLGLPVNTACWAPWGGVRAEPKQSNWRTWGWKYQRRQEHQEGRAARNGPWGIKKFVEIKMKTWCRSRAQPAVLCLPLRVGKVACGPRGFSKNGPFLGLGRPVGRKPGKANLIAEFKGAPKAGAK